MDFWDQNSETEDPNPCLIPGHEWHPSGTDIMFDKMKYVFEWPGPWDGVLTICRLYQ